MQNHTPIVPPAANMVVPVIIDPDSSSMEAFVLALELGGSAVPATVSITYDDGGNVKSYTEDGITTTYTYNPDGTVATDTRSGVIRTYTYDGSGNLTGIES